MQEHGNVRFRISCAGISCLSRPSSVWKPSIGEKLVAKREFNNPMDKHAVKVVKGDGTVGHLSRKFSQIT